MTPAQFPPPCTSRPPRFAEQVSASRSFPIIYSLSRVLFAAFPIRLLYCGWSKRLHLRERAMTHRTTRRRFLKTSTFAGLSVWIAPAAVRAAASPNEKLNIGVIGTTNRAGENLKAVSSENIVALCDVDERLLGPVAEKYPAAAKFTDFRKMLETT